MITFYSFIFCAALWLIGDQSSAQTQMPIQITISALSPSQNISLDICSIGLDMHFPDSRGTSSRTVHTSNGAELIDREHRFHSIHLPSLGITRQRQHSLDIAGTQPCVFFVIRHAEKKKLSCGCLPCDNKNNQL